MSQDCQVRIRFCAPPAVVAHYFTSFYLAEIVVAGGGIVEDFLHPEWGNLRFHSGSLPEAQSQSGMRVSGSRFTVTGPSSHATHFRVGTCRLWGVGLLPLGWARYIGAPAAALADAVLDGEQEPAVSDFRELAECLFGPEPDEAGELARLGDWFLARAGPPLPDEARISALHAALVDAEVDTVAQLVERTGASQRTVERLCARAFGFSPKLLLRRQRLMRSLAHYMVDPSLKWIGSMDGHYHDQAQFIRDFQRFMGMSPRVYAAMPHPVLDAFVRERQRLAGSPVQTLDGPGGWHARA